MVNVGACSSIYPLSHPNWNSKFKTLKQTKITNNSESWFFILLLLLLHFSLPFFPFQLRTTMEEGNTDLPCPSPTPFRSSSLLKDISNFKTPKRSSFSLNAQSPSTQYFTAPKSKQTTLLRRPKKSSTAASKKLKAFQLEQSHSSRNAQIKKEQSLKSLAKSLTVWLNFLLESPASCGCELSIAGVQIADASPATKGKRDTVSRNSVGVDSSWRTPKRQRKTAACSSRVGKEIVSNADSQSSLFLRLKDSLKDVCSFDDFKQRMSVYLSLGTCEDIFHVMNHVTKVCFLSSTRFWLKFEL